MSVTEIIEEVKTAMCNDYCRYPREYDGAYANNGKTACKCAEEHRQLAEWLKQLKGYEDWMEDYS